MRIISGEAARGAAQGALVGQAANPDRPGRIECRATSRVCSSNRSARLSMPGSVRMSLHSVRSSRILWPPSSRRYGPTHVLGEWASLTGEECVYSPRIDAAVGPFAAGSTRHRAVVDELLTALRTFIERLVDTHRENVRQLRGTDAVPSLDSTAARNSNARCCPARVRRHPATQVFVGCLLDLPSNGWQNRADTAIQS
jgi:hypothetical protein